MSAMTTAKRACGKQSPRFVYTRLTARSVTLRARPWHRPPGQVCQREEAAMT
jgi:hypothetical protein